MSAAVILLVTWVIATVLKRVLTTLLGKLPFLNRPGGSGGDNLAASIGAIAALIVWLFGLIAVLNVFDLNQVITPLQDLLSSALGVLPGILGAALVFVVGLVLAKIAREVVEIALQSTGADAWLAARQSTSTTGESAEPATASDDLKISTIVGQLVFALVLIVVSISALQILGIEAISEPATEMLSLILNAVPSILAAAILLGIGALVAGLVAPILEGSLRSMGVDNSLRDLGVAREGASASNVISRIAQVAILLFFAVAATRVLGFPEITNILETVLSIGGRVLFGGAVIAAGVLIANILARLVSGRTVTVVRYATIALFAAIGLQFMGLADAIVTLAFGSIVVGGALAAALAFGLGGRDAAARQLQKMQDSQTS